MTPDRLLGFLLVTTLALTASPAFAQGASPEDPCAVARRIAESPPCREKSDCEAVNLWRQAFPPPGSQQAAADPVAELASRLPDVRIHLPQGARPLGEVAAELAAAAGLQLLIDPRLDPNAPIRMRGGSLSLEEAWRGFLLSAGLSADLLTTGGPGAEGRVLLREAPAPGQPQGWGPSFDCPAR
jgi:hypothetical protein